MAKSLSCLALTVPVSAGQHAFAFGSLLLLLLLLQNLSLKVCSLQMMQDVTISVLFAARERQSSPHVDTVDMDDRHGGHMTSI